MGLRNLVCLLPAETPSHGHHDEEDMEQPGTSYNSSEVHSFSSTENGKAAARGRDRVYCSSGGAQILACFRAGAINLIVHPAMAMGGQRQGASTVQPVTSLPRAAFLDGAEDHDSGDDPTSPVVTCIGQVRKDKPSKTPTKSNPDAPDLRSLKQKQWKLLESSASSSPRPSKWKQILGARGTVNPSQQTPQTQSSESSELGEFHIDLNRFGSACSTIPQDQIATPSFGHMSNTAPGRTSFPAGTNPLLAKPSHGGGHVGVEAREEPALRSPPVLRVDLKPSAEVLLWKRRSGACKPLTLELKRRVLRSDFR